MSKYSSGVLFGAELEALYNDAKDNQFALPAVNVIGTDSINATLETAAKVNSPVIIQFSNGGAQFMAAKECRMINYKPIFLAVFQVHCIYIM
ncbi:MAG: class II fructose-bisphosphate aldolase [Ferruginibacter sp.]